MNPAKPTARHEALVELLPWYVNGTLDETERGLVQRHVEACAECREDVEMLAAAQRGIRNESPAPLVPAPNTERLLAALDGTDRRSVLRTWPLIAAAAAVAAIAIAAAWQLAPRPATAPTLFETLTSPAIDRSINYVLEVQFVPDADAQTHSTFFESIGAGDLAVPLSDRAYRIALGLGTVTLAELEQYADEIESRPEIATARFVAVQFPVE